jgi:uncharacterized protein (TIGR02147 family)
MIKKINNIYDYSDYRLLLADDFMARSANNYSYSLRAYARDLSLSPGFVSDVLRGNKDLSPAKGRQVFTLLQYEGEELDYIEKLIIFKSSPHEAARQDAYQYIHSRLNRVKFESDNSKDLIIQSFAHFTTYGITRKVNELSEILKFTEQLGLTADETKNALADFVQHQYIFESEGRYQVNDAKLTLTNHELLLSFLNQFNNHLASLIQKNGGIKPPENVAHGLILGLNQQSYDLALEAHKHFIKSMDRIANQSTTVDRFILLSDFMMTTAV